MKAKYKWTTHKEQRGPQVLKTWKIKELKGQWVKHNLKTLTDLKKLLNIQRKFRYKDPLLNLIE